MSPRPRLPCLLATLCVGAAVLWAPGARAQDAPVVSVLRVEPGAEAICAQIERALARFAQVPDPGYHAEAQRSGLDPASEEAMGELAPLVGADLVLVPLAASDDALSLAYVDGRTGESLGTVELPLDSGGLGFVARNRLVNETRSRLAAMEGGAGSPPAAGPAPGAPDAGYGAAGYDDTGYDADEPAAADDETGLSLRLAAGAGVGTRSLEWPTAAGTTRVVDLGAFTAVEVGATLRIVPSDSFALGAQVGYQSSFLHQVDEQHEGGFTRPMAIRAHHLDAGLVPELRFGETRGLRLAFTVGYGLRSLRPEVHHLLTPDYTLGGPLLRLGLRIPLGQDLALRLSPEGQWIIQVSDALQERGVDGSGFAVGGQGALEIGLSEVFGMELTYRESHALLGARAGQSASDVERFATARLTGEL